MKCKDKIEALYRVYLKGFSCGCRGDAPRLIEPETDQCYALAVGMHHAQIPGWMPWSLNHFRQVCKTFPDGSVELGELFTVVIGEGE